MKSDDIPMYDDPSTPAYLRDLLHAGRNARSDYDVKRGLAQHRALIGTAPMSPAAHWGTSAAAAAAKAGLPAWLGFVVLPLAAASIVGLVWVSASAPNAAPATSRPGNAAVAPSESPVPTVAGDSLSGSTPRDHAGVGTVASNAHAAGGADESRSHAALDRRARGAARSPAAHSASRAVRIGSSERTGSESAASDLNIEATQGVRADDSVAARSGDTDLAAAPNPYVGSKPASAQSVRQDSARVAADERDPQADEERTAAGTATKAKKPSTVPVVDEGRLEREMQMLAVTQRVLASNPERALRLAQQGEREFAGSMFSAERRQLGLLALVKLGRLEEARRAGRPFLARYPNAPWSERLRRALSTGTVE